MINHKELIHKNEIELIKNHIENKKKSIIVHGPYGVGKTFSIYSIANELNYELIELNPANITEEFVEMLQKGVQQQSLFKKGKIVLVDELENIEKRKISLIQEMISAAECPIIMTVNDLYNQKISAIKKSSNIIEFKKPSYKEITNILEKHCKKENINYSIEDLENISKLSNNDIRAATNDLMVSTSNKNLNINLDCRDVEQNIQNALQLIFKTKEFDLARNAFNDVPLDLDECILWLDENLPLEYKNEDLIEAYELLSRSTIYKARIRKRQYYRLLVYQSALATGISLVKKEKNNQLISYKRPSRLLKIYISNRKNHLRNSICKKLAFKTHGSYKNTLNEFPLLKQILSKNEDYNNLKLTEEEIIFLKT